MSDTEVNTAKLVGDLKVVVRDAEELLKATASDMGDKARAAREKLGEAIDKAKANCRSLEEKALAGAKVADGVIREHPYHAIGVGFGLGILLGVLVTRR